MYMLAFFPWLKIEQKIELSDFKLVPFERGKFPGPAKSELQNTCDKILESYIFIDNKDISVVNKPIEKCTLILLKDKQILEKFTEDEREYLFFISHMITFAGLSKRKYFGLRHFKYCNSANFEFYIQSLKEDLESIAYIQRRRDIAHINYENRKAYKVKMPHSVNYSFCFELDIPLLKTLLKVKNGLKEKYFEAIFNFNIANTDADLIPSHMEVVMIASAFQRILDCKGGTEDELAINFLDIFHPFQNFDVKKSIRVKRTKYEGKDITLKEVWLRDFYQLRGNYAHGKNYYAHGKKMKLWTTDEHLLLSSYVFPLAVKCQLQKDRLYTLTESDKSNINVFEKLADTNLFKKQNGISSSESSEWDRIRTQERIRSYSDN